MGQEKVREQGLINEADAAHRLGISRSSLRQYVSSHQIAAIARVVPRLGRGRQHFVYEFSPDALDEFDAKRQQGLAVRATWRGARCLTKAQICELLLDPQWTLAEIASRANRSREMIRIVGEQVGIGGGERLARRREEKKNALFSKMLEDFEKNEPAWHRALRTECERPEIFLVFKPHIVQRNHRFAKLYRTAWINRRACHLHYGKIWAVTGRRYVVIHIRNTIPEDQFRVAVGFAEDKNTFFFWIIPASVINECSGRIYLPVDEMAHRPFGHSGEEVSRSPWIQYRDNWDALRF